MVVHPAGHLDGDEAAQRRDDAAHGQDDKGADESGGLALGPEALALDDEEDEHGGAHDQGDDVGGVDDVQGQRRAEQGDGHDPRTSLPAQNAARQHDHADAGDGHQGAGGLDDGDREVLRNEVQVGP